MYNNEVLRRLQDALKFNNSSATFFVTGKYYLQNKALVHQILDNGFEVGYHGHNHIKITNKDILNAELINSRVFIENVKPIGFRAPWIYFPESLIDNLSEWGFRYDSSTFSSAGTSFQLSGLDIYPVTSLQYFGIEVGPIYPKCADLRMLQNEIPIGSGIFVSMLRCSYNSILNYFNKHNKSMVLYIHDWQLFIPQEKHFNIWKDRIKYVHRFPLLNNLLMWIDTHHFECLSSRLNIKKSEPKEIFSHYLTIDVEYLGAF